MTTTSVRKALRSSRCSDQSAISRLKCEALTSAFQFDQSAARPAGSMAARGLIVFKHDNELGRAPSHELFERVSIVRKNPDAPARQFSDYELKVDEAGLREKGIAVERKC
ncbi:MAG: type I CRISPR-associated protein Cas7 [Thermoanaerobaculaceae bacterium]